MRDDFTVPGEGLPLLVALALTLGGSACAVAATLWYQDHATAERAAPRPAPTAEPPTASAGDTSAPAAPASVPSISAPPAVAAASTSAPASAAAPVTAAQMLQAPATPKTAAPASAAVAPATDAAIASAPVPSAALAPATDAAVAPASVPASAPASVPPASAAPARCALARVAFARGRRIPAAEALTGLTDAVDWIGAAPDRTLLIRGHSDAGGADGYNLRLSAARARWIRDRLAQRGAPADRMTVQAFGEYMPTLEARPDDARQRRVEIFGLGGPCPTP